VSSITEKRGKGKEPEARWGFQLGLPPALEHKKQCGWLSVIKTK